jgi:hypothetical protein
MSRKWRLFLFGLAAAAVLAGCGRSYMLGQREAWRKEAEIACMKSGAIKESEVLVRADPIEGPGMCGAEFPLKVAALGMIGAMGYSDDLRPPGAIPGASQPSSQPRWPVAEPAYRNPYGSPRAAPSAPPASSREYEPRHVEPRGSAPMTIVPPGREPAGNPVGTYDRSSSMGSMRAAPAPAPIQATPKRRSIFDPPPSASAAADDEDDVDDTPPPRSSVMSRAAPYSRSPYARSPSPVPLRSRTLTGAIGPVEVKPAATLACPIVSALDQWILTSVQPMAKHWFGQPVVEIKQISAYSCRGMNGNPNSRISEHAFGNALDISAFILADGRRVSVKDGWLGAPQEQGFLRDIQGAACEQFTTVLAPGSNRFHYDHIHVDLMRRPSGRVVCEPGAVSGEVVAQRAGGRNYARRVDPGVTGSIGSAKTRKPGNYSAPEKEDEEWMAAEQTLADMRKKDAAVLAEEASPKSAPVRRERLPLIMNRESLATP